MRFFRVNRSIIEESGSVERISRLFRTMDSRLQSVVEHTFLTNRIPKQLIGLSNRGTDSPDIENSRGTRRRGRRTGDG